MSVDAIIARLSPSERAHVAADLSIFGRMAAGEFWDPKSETVLEFHLEKRTTRFLEQLLDVLRSA